MKWAIFALIFSASWAGADTINSCSEIRGLQTRLAMSAYNLANINTTRTPEGGPYRPFMIDRCSSEGCHVIRSKARIYKYQPDHPDADRHGYVAFPMINQRTESATFQLTAERLKFLASRHVCGAHLITDNGPSSFTIGYGHGSVQEDLVNFNRFRQPVSWTRSYFAGNVDVTNFRLNPGGGTIY